jgi:outer membrane protein OmpA-like peptidoglycan-associated protein
MKLFLTLLFITTLLYSKTDDFSIIIHKPFNAALFDITQNYDRTISAVGFSIPQQTLQNESQSYTNAFDYLASLSNKHSPQTTLVTIDNNAEIIQESVASLNYCNKALCFVKRANGGYFIAAYAQDGSLLLLQTNRNLKPLFKKRFGTKNRNRLHKLLALRDGGVLAIGSSYTSRNTSDSLFMQGLGKNDIFLTRFDSKGKIVWSKKYGTADDESGIDAAEAADGSLLILAQKEEQKVQKVIAMRIDTNGNKLWLKEILPNSSHNESIKPQRLIRLHNNNFLALMTQYDKTQKEHIVLLKLNIYGKVLQTSTILTNYPSALVDIKEFANSMLMGVGYVKDRYDQDALAMLISNDLSMLKQEHYGDESFDAFYALDILNNSQVAVAGLHTDKNSQEQNMWIVKLNQDATLAQISMHSKDFYTALVKLFAKEISQGKIIIKKDLTIELCDPTLYFQAGEYKLTKAQKDFLQSFSKKLINFLYANRNIVKEFQIDGHTSSEWSNVDFQNRYLNNENLSMKRAFSVLRTIFLRQNHKEQKWLTTVIAGSGFAYSQRVFNKKEEDKIHSRRVNFKILLK